MSNIQDMNNRIKQNRARRPSKRPKFKGNNRKVVYSKDKKSEPLTFKTIPEKKLIEIKKQIRNLAKANQKRERIIYGVFIIIGIVILASIVFKVIEWLN